MLSPEESRIVRIPRSIGLLLLLRVLIYTPAAIDSESAQLFRLILAADLAAGVLLFLGRNQAARLPVLAGLLLSGAGFLPGILLHDGSSWRIAAEGVATLTAGAVFFLSLRLLRSFSARDARLAAQPIMTPDDDEGAASD